MTKHNKGNIFFKEYSRTWSSLLSLPASFQKRKKSLDYGYITDFITLFQLYVHTFYINASNKYCQKVMRLVHIFIQNSKKQG